MTQTPCAYDERNWPHTYPPIAPEAELSRYTGPTHLPYLQPNMTPRDGVVQQYNHVSLSGQSMPYHGESHPPRFSHPSYSLMTSADISADYTSLDFAQPTEIHNPWGTSHPSSNLLLNATYDVPSGGASHHPTSNPTLYPDPSSCQSLWPAGNNEAGFDDFSLAPPSDYMPATVPNHNSGPSLHPNPTPQPFSEGSEASYPCLWTEGGVICHVMVQASRSQMNRHLHAYHGFGGSDTQQTRCCWSGCGETMQQGSIARHMVTCHLQAKVTCPTCSKKLSRQDVISKHQRVCPAASAWR